MIEYTCPRCGYFSYLRSNIRKHFNRKRECQIKLENIPISECFQTILNEENILVTKSNTKNAKNAILGNTKVTQGNTKVTQNFDFFENSSLLILYLMTL